MTMDNRILLVDDDEELLELFVARLGGQFNLVTAGSASEGMALLGKEKFKVVVSDYDMPVTNGIEFLGQVAETAPHSVRMMLTGTGDLAVAKEAVNSGHVFMFENKPIVISQLSSSLHACIREFDVADKERTLLEGTLNGAVRVLKDVMSMISPLAFSRANRLSNYANQLCSFGVIPETWSFKLAAMLSQVGCISVPGEVLQKVIAGQELDSVENAMYNRFPAEGAKMIEEIPMLEGVAAIVRNQRKSHGDIKGLVLDQDIKVAANALKMIGDFDLWLETGHSSKEVVAKLKGNASEYYPSLLGVVDQLQDFGEYMNLVSATVSNLSPRMVLAEDVESDDGSLLIPQGMELGFSGITMLRNSMDLKNLSPQKEFRVYERAGPSVPGTVG